MWIKIHMTSCLVVLSGGALGVSKLTLMTQKRVEKAVEMYTTSKQKPYLIMTSGYSPKKPVYLYEDGLPSFECDAMTRVAIDLGVDPVHILREWSSQDTIGNAYFTLVQHIIPLKLQNVTIITSSFHMERTQTIFGKVYSLAPFPIELNYVETDDGLDEDVFRVRIKREVGSIKILVENTLPKINSIVDLHRWMHTEHDRYNCSFKTEKISSELAKSY